MNNQPAIKGVPSNIPQLVEMNKAISAGRTFRLPHHFWKAGLDKQIAIELVNAILDGKKDLSTATRRSRRSSRPRADGVPEVAADVGRCPARRRLTAGAGRLRS
jgi:hypothetical protein